MITETDLPGGPEPHRRDGERCRRPYRPPRLEVLGDVRDLTFGGSPGIGDSGFPNTNPLGTP